MTALPPPRLYDPKADKWLLDSIAQLHIDCITQDHTLATFLPPLSHSKVLASWQVWSDQVENGSRVMMLQMAPAGSGDNPLPQHPSGEIILAGVVSLSFPDTETGSHRSEVGRLFTSPDFRRRGVARRLMVALEPIAVERERWLMMLDTTIGSGAEHVYPKLGYKEVGRIPKYGFSPKNGEFVDEVFFYKDLKHG